MVRATVGATVSQSVSLALSLPQQDSASLAFTPGTAGSANDTLSERTVVRRRFNRSDGLQAAQHSSRHQGWLSVLSCSPVYMHEISNMHCVVLSIGV